MALSNLLESYISSIENITNYLDGIDEKVYRDLHSEINNFYELHDEATILYDTYKKYELTTDCESFNESVLSSCVKIRLLLNEYSHQANKDFDGYKKILSNAAHKQLNNKLKEYKVQLDQYNECQKLISDCNSLIKKCRSEIIKHALTHPNEIFSHCEEYVSNISSLKYESVAEHVKKISISKLAKTRNSLEEQFIEYKNFGKSLKEYTKVKQEYQESVLKKQSAVAVSLEKVSNVLINPKSKSYDTFIESTNHLLCQINAFEYKTLDPNGEFIQIFNKQSIEKLNDSFSKLQSLYTETIQYISNALDIISECKLLLAKCEIILDKYGVKQSADGYLAIKSYLLNIKTSGFYDFENFKSTLNIALLRKTKASLEAIIDDAAESKKSFEEYDSNKKKLLDFLHTQNRLLHSAKKSIDSFKINTTKLAYSDACTKVIEYLEKIESFKPKTLNPNKEFKAEYDYATIVKSISSIVDKAVSEIICAKKKQIKVILSIAGIALIAIILLFNPYLFQHIITGLKIIGFLILGFVMIFLFISSKK